MQPVDLGFVKFEVTRQSIIAFVFAISFMLLSAGISLIPLYKLGVIRPHFLIILGTVLAIVAILYGILIAYAMNCLIVGKCIKLSWVFVGLQAFSTLVYILFFIFSIMKGTALPQTSMSRVISKNLKSR